METSAPPFPAQLLNWAGNRAGGVRRLFDQASGRPGDAVFETNLLHRLRAWSTAIVDAPGSAPRILLLVGGPGNGKTEAIESVVCWLDKALGANAALCQALMDEFFPPEGTPVPRLVRIDAGALGTPPRDLTISIVQDASTVGSGRLAAQALLDELDLVISAPSQEAYLCCVNRGILDDALIEAIDQNLDRPRQLLEAVTRAVSLSPDAPACWPLDEFPAVAVWPMDVESLLLPPVEGGEPPARRLLLRALEESDWPVAGNCPAGVACPFCGSRERLTRDREQASLLQILRWFEVGTAKRWSFRDLFSLVSYLLAGHRVSTRDTGLAPCEWAAKMVELDKQACRGGRPTKEESTAIFNLVAAQYQHALFHRWDRDAGPALLKDLKDLGYDDDNTAMGLQWFLASRRSPYLPTMISDALDALADLLDPALANPDTEIQATRNTRFALREVDVRFSRSVTEGLEYLRRLQVLTRVEVDLMERLGQLDSELSVAAVRRKRPAAATNVQRLVRDFASRLARRALGARCASVRDAAILEQFQRVVEDEGGDDLFDVAGEVEQLLNVNQDFEISLTTTFGQPLPPPMRRATLIVQQRSVKALEERVPGRPASPVCFLLVGDGRSGQPIALTYELFKAVKELEQGMSVASLPRTVLALLDTTRARLSGPIVRDRAALDRARIRIGRAGTTVVERRSGFATRKDGGAR